MRKPLVLIGIMALSTFGVAQNAQAESQDLRALLEEVRGLRKDLQTTMVASQRVQIALYRLQLQETAVARATKTTEDIREKLAGLTAERKRLAANIEQGEDSRSRTQNISQRQVIEEEV